MKKHNIILDTSIYRKNPSRSDLAFQALERLCKAQVLKLHVPYVVEREFQTQQAALYRKDIDAARSALDALVRRGLSAVDVGKVKKIRDELDQLASGILDEVASAIVRWAEGLQAQRHQLIVDQALAAMESYFAGTPPLRAAKTREDIPDAFIFQTILAVARECVPLVVIAEDDKIAKSSEQIKGVTVYPTLASFIEADEIQKAILDLDVIDNLEAISAELEKYEANTHDLTAYVRDESGEKLVWERIRSDTIPDDNHEATITGYYEPEDIEFNFAGVSYFGNGEFGLPFTFTNIVQATFYIFKSDYYCMDVNEAPHVSDHNDHYFEAEDEFDVRISGLLRLSIETGELNSISAETLREHLTLGIDSIEEISVPDV